MIFLHFSSTFNRFRTVLSYFVTVKNTIHCSKLFEESKITGMFISIV